MLKTIIFDLDGTLWHTEASYIYAYHKLCDLCKVARSKTDEEIKECLGIKADLVIKHLFPQAKDQTALTLQAVKFSIEYLLEHSDECCFEGVSELLKDLSRNFSIYLVSNCPREYANTFMSISKTEKFISGIYNIEDGEKIDNVRKIAEKTEGKILYVGDSTDDYDALSDRYSQYFCYAKYGYKKCSQYDFSINSPLELHGVIRELQIKERQSNGAPYRVLSNGDNQITLIKKDENTSYFGFVKYADESFEAVVKELIQSTDTKLIGPINFNTFYTYRFATDNYNWRLYPDLCGEKEIPVFLKNGFKINQDYDSSLVDIDYKIWKKAQKVKLPDEYTTIEIHGDEVYSYLEDIYTVAASSFEDAYLYEPISREDFMDIYVEALRQVTPSLLLFYRKGTPVAFCFCYDDPEKRFFVCKTLAITKDERNSKVIYKLIDRTFAMVEKFGYKQCLLHFRNLRSRGFVAIFRKSTVKKKKYALLEYGNDK